MLLAAVLLSVADQVTVNLHSALLTPLLTPLEAVRASVESWLPLSPAMLLLLPLRGRQWSSQESSGGFSSVVSDAVQGSSNATAATGSGGASEALLTINLAGGKWEGQSGMESLMLGVVPALTASVTSGFGSMYCQWASQVRGGERVTGREGNRARDGSSGGAACTANGRCCRCEVVRRSRDASV